MARKAAETMPRVDETLELAHSLAYAARDLAAALGPQATLDEACQQAVAVIAGCDWAGICEKNRDGRAQLLAASDQTVRTLHDLQYDLDSGPCRNASFEQRIIVCDDFASDQQWPRFAAAAVSQGARSLASIQLYALNNAVVTLHLYSATPGAFDEVTVDVAQIFGAHAASAISGARENAHMSQALVARQQIGQLTGILAERHRLTTDEAFALVVRISQDNNIKIRDLAARLVAEEDNARHAQRSRSSMP